MFPFSSIFARYFSRLPGFPTGRRQPSRRRKNAARLTVEALEERQVPTVLFKPLFGAEASSHPESRVCLTNFNVCSSLQSPNIYPIFWGNYWLENPAAKQLADAFSKIVESGYLSGTTQYLTDGLAKVMPAFVDLANDVPSQIGPGYNNPASLEIEHVLYDENRLPKPDEAPNATEPIYVVITGPDVAGAGDNGFNQPGFHTVPDADVREEIWLGTRLTPGGQLDLDYTTRTFSHELAEAATDPLGPVGLLSPLGINGPSGEQVAPGSGFTGNTSAGGLENQIADNEPNNNYVYRLGGPTGVLAQAYWSDADNQYAVPDGNSLSVQIKPDLWSPNGNGQQAFSGGTLVVDANQPGVSPGNHVITLDTYTNPAGQQGVQVVMDGQSFAFEPGQINNIEVKSADDSETIAVDGALSGVPVNIDLGTGQYVVKLDPKQFDPIQSKVTVNASPGGKEKVELAPTGDVSAIDAPVQVNGDGTGTALTYNVSGLAILTGTLTGASSGSFPLPNGTVSYSGVATVTLNPSGGPINHLVLQGSPFGGFASEKVTVTGAGAGSVVLDGGTINYSHVTELDDLAQAQSAVYDFTATPPHFGAPVSVVDGPVVSGTWTTSLQQTFTSPGGTQVTDPVEFAHKTGVTVQGPAWNGSISVDNPTPADGLATLAIDGQGSASVTVKSTAAAVATSVSNSATVTLHAQGQGVQAIRGAIDVEGSKLIVDDTGDTTPHQQGNKIILYDTLLSNLAPGQITWGGLSSLTVFGGSGGNSYVLQSQGSSPTTALHAGDGNDTIFVDIREWSDFALTVDGGAGNDELDIYGESPKAHIDSSPTDQHSGKVSASIPSGPSNALTSFSNINYQNIETLSIKKASDVPELGTNGRPLRQGQDEGDPSTPGHQTQPPHAKARKVRGQGRHPQKAHHPGRHSRRARGA
jgi:hypothetical protein